MGTRPTSTSSAHRAGSPWVALGAWIAALAVATFALGLRAGPDVASGHADLAARIVRAPATAVRYVVPASDAETRAHPAPGSVDAPRAPDEAAHAAPARLSVSAARASSAPPRVVGAGPLDVTLPSVRACRSADLHTVGRIARRSVSHARSRASLMVFLN